MMSWGFRLIVVFYIRDSRIANNYLEFMLGMSVFPGSHPKARSRCPQCRHTMGDDWPRPSTCVVNSWLASEIRSGVEVLPVAIKGARIPILNRLEDDNHEFSRPLFTAGTN